VCAEEIFGPKRYEVTADGESCIIRSFITCTLSEVYIIRMIKLRRMRWAGHVARMGRRGTHERYWWETQKGKRPLGRPRRRWVDNIRMDLGEVGWGDVD
jgi:hypothetical protein